MATTYKILLFMKRGEGVPIAAFRANYETRHVPLCERYSSGVTRYLRRCIEPQLSCPSM